VGPASPPDRPHRRVELLLALGLLLLAGPLIQEWSAQPASRYLLTVAAVEDRSLELDPYADLLGLDRAEYRGHIYSDKAPYQPLLVAPLLEIYDTVGGDAFPRPADEVTVRDLLDETHRGLWWVALWSSTIPAIALAVVIRRLVLPVHPGVATAVAVALTVGTTVLPFASLLFGHVMAALWVGLAWLLAREPDAGGPAVFGAGVALGLAIGTEYSTAVVALALLVAVLVAGGFARAVLLSAGTVVASAPLLLYNWLVFEDPFEVSYQGHLSSFEGEGALGVYNLTLPKPEEMARALIGQKGLFVLTPVMLLAFAGCAYAISAGGRARRDAVFALVAFVAMLLVSTGVDGLGGDTPGPRYLIPVLPLFAVPLAEAWRRQPRACVATALIGTVWMTLASITDPLAPSFRAWLRAVPDGELAANVITGHSHTWVILVTTAAGFLLLAHVVRRDTSDPPARAG
jgi:hypothetical protein